MAIQGDHTSRRIVIVGGGIAGLSVAVRLGQTGFAVTLLEASHLGQGLHKKPGLALQRRRFRANTAESRAALLRLAAADDSLLSRLPGAGDGTDDLYCLIV